MSKRKYYELPTFYKDADFIEEDIKPESDEYDSNDEEGIIEDE